MRRLINRLNDYAFKRIFGVEENKDILLDQPLTRDCEIHFLELPKFTRLRRPVQTRLDKWLTYLSNAEGHEMEVIAMNEPAIKKAITIEEIFAKNDNERRLYELREKGLRDIESFRLKTLAEGKAEAAGHIARAMLKEGIDHLVVAKTTGLSVDEIKRLSER